MLTRPAPGCDAVVGSERQIKPRRRSDGYFLRRGVLCFGSDIPVVQLFKGQQHYSAATVEGGETGTDPCHRALHSALCPERCLSAPHGLCAAGNDQALRALAVVT